MVGAVAFEKMMKVFSAVLPQGETLDYKQHVTLQIWSLMHGAVSLQHHAVTRLVDMSDWRNQALQAVELLVEAIAARSK